MAGLLDFLQAASNEAAGTVSAPVDGLAWLLRKAGIPVNAPIGGSDWMEQRGLTRPVKQSTAQVAGATAGLLSPVAAAAKAPQIARGLLQAGDNIVAPRQLHPQAGALLMPNTKDKWFHASTEEFDNFDLGKFGSGGLQNYYGGKSVDSFTPGVYATTSPEHAQSYGDVLYELTPKSKLITNTEKVASELNKWAKENGYKSAQHMIDTYYDKSPYAASDFDARIDALLKSAKSSNKHGAIIDFGNLVLNGKAQMGRVGAFTSPDLFDWRRVR